MAHPALGSLLRHLRRLRDLADAGDGELLHRHLGGDRRPLQSWCVVMRRWSSPWALCL